uniref:C2H2-type domain-containing protein n=1 Tax=Sparus aurata TaxID=8175 RepID=A0A671TSZ2_SPAAU
MSEPEPPQIKEEQEELCSSQEGEQLVLKQETDTSIEPEPERGKHGDSGSTRKPFSCNCCGKSFRMRKSLILHMRVHTGEKPFSCRTCGKDFRSSSNLLDHMRVHTGGKPFPCNTCGTEFRTRYSLSLHMRVHTGEKPIYCKTCGKGSAHTGQTNEMLFATDNVSVIECIQFAIEMRPPYVSAMM